MIEKNSQGHTNGETIKESQTVKVKPGEPQQPANQVQGDEIQLGSHFSLLNRSIPVSGSDLLFREIAPLENLLF